MEILVVGSERLDRGLMNRGRFVGPVRGAPGRFCAAHDFSGGVESAIGKEKGWVAKIKKAIVGVGGSAANPIGQQTFPSMNGRRMIVAKDQKLANGLMYIV